MLDRLGNFMRTLAVPKTVQPWSLTSLREKLIKIGAKVVSHGRYGPADRPARCAETTHDAGATRCPAPADDRRPAQTAPDPNASLCGSRPAASTRTDRAA